MQYLGNILTDCELDDFYLFNVVKNEADLSPDIPTIITGWKKVKDKYPEQSIIDWKISDNLFWTFGEMEKRDKMEKDLKKFKELCFNRINEQVKYTFYNILKNKGEYPLWCDRITSMYINNDLVYCYVRDDNTVYGISLRDVQYYNIDPKTLLRTLYNSSNPKVVKKTDGITYETINSLRKNTYLIPFVFDS